MFQPVRESCGHSYTCMECQRKHFTDLQQANQKMHCIQCPTCNHRAFCKKKYEINKNLHGVIRVLFGEYDDAYRRAGTRE